MQDLTDATVGGVEADDTGGQVVRLMERALTNMSPKDPRSCKEGGSSLKNKLLYRRADMSNSYSVSSSLVKQAW